MRHKDEQTWNKGWGRGSWEGIIGIRKSLCKVLEAGRNGNRGSGWGCVMETGACNPQTKQPRLSPGVQESPGLQGAVKVTG